MILKKVSPKSTPNLNSNSKNNSRLHSMFYNMPIQKKTYTDRNYMIYLIKHIESREKGKMYT